MTGLSGSRSWPKPQGLLRILLLCWQVAYGASVPLKLVGAGGPLQAVAGQDLVLPCVLSPGLNAQNMTVVWYRLGADTQTPIHRHAATTHRNEFQAQSYEGRTALFPGAIAMGNMSLRLGHVKLSDAGTYQCTVDAGHGNNDNVDILVQVRAIGTEPTILMSQRNNSQLALQCVSSGWSPVPVVDWLDVEGRNLSAEPTETHLESEGYRVQRRLLVDRRSNSSSFLCRVSQMGLVKETQKNITDEDEPKEPESFPLKIILAVVCSTVTVVLLVVIKAMAYGGLKESGARRLLGHIRRTRHSHMQP